VLDDDILKIKGIQTISKNERSDQKRFFRYPEDAQFGEQFIDAINKEWHNLKYHN